MSHPPTSPSPSRPSADDGEMQINLTHSLANAAAAHQELLQQEAALMSPSSGRQILNIPTSNPMLSRGTLMESEPPVVTMRPGFGWLQESPEEGELEEEEVPQGKGLSLNPFWMSASLSSSSSKQMELPQLSLAPKLAMPALQDTNLAQIDAASSFYSASPAIDLYNGLHTFLKAQYGARIMLEQHPTVACLRAAIVLPTEPARVGGGVVNFHVCFMEAPEDASSSASNSTAATIVEVQRRSGERRLFATLFDSIVQEAQRKHWYLRPFVASASDSDSPSSCPPRISRTMSMDPPPFDDFDDAALDRTIKQALMAQAAPSVEFQQPQTDRDDRLDSPILSSSKQSRQAMSLLLAAAGRLQQSDALELFKHGIVSYDRTQQFQSLLLLDSLLANSASSNTDTSSLSTLCPLLISTAQAVPLSTSLQDVLLMRELTRALLGLIVATSASFRFSTDQRAVLDYKIQEWSQDAIVAAQLNRIVATASQ